MDEAPGHDRLIRVVPSIVQVGKDLERKVCSDSLDDPCDRFTLMIQNEHNYFRQGGNPPPKKKPSMILPFSEMKCVMKLDVESS